MNKKLRGQSAVDFVLAFVAIGVLIVGITRIWVWFNSNYAMRQMSYQRSRMLASNPIPSAAQPLVVTQNMAPVSIGANPGNFSNPFIPIDLTEEWVFRGDGIGSGVPYPGGPGYMDPEAFCRQLESVEPLACGGTPGCGVYDPDPNVSTFNYECPCFVKCQCNIKTNETMLALLKQVESLCGPHHTQTNCFACSDPINSCGFPDYNQNQAAYGQNPNATYGNDPINNTPSNNSQFDPNSGSGASSCGQACTMRKNAQSMDNQAEQCDDWWEPCNWGGGGQAMSKMKSAANDLRANAAEAEAKGTDMLLRVNGTKNCCDNVPQIVAQNLCLQAVNDEAFNCTKEANGMSAMWQQKKDKAQIALDETKDAIRRINQDGILPDCMSNPGDVYESAVYTITQNAIGAAAAACLGGAANTTCFYGDNYSCPTRYIDTHLIGSCSFSWNSWFNNGIGSFAGNPLVSPCTDPSTTAYTACSSGCTGNGTFPQACVLAMTTELFATVLEQKQNGCCGSVELKLGGKTSATGKNCVNPYDASLKYLADVDLLEVKNKLELEIATLTCNQNRVLNCCTGATSVAGKTNEALCVADPVSFFKCTPTTQGCNCQN